MYRGRAKKLSEQQLIDARRLIGDGVPKSQVARQLRVNPSTLYRALARPDVA
ncbi:helix-turn-helix domain-containing protein [Rathayibacter sp. AY1B7]|uniref:helix-turn-helix domain-containing protein n=1 Tax=Rathayibacter sp. AY1B7 TaxID=2080532 RepID=UPI001C668FF6